MGQITLAQYRTNVRGLVGDTSYDMTLTDQAINWFINEIHNNNHIRYMEESDMVNISAGDTIADLPDDLNNMLALTSTSPQVLDILRGRMEFGDFMKLYPGWATYTPQQVRRWTDFSNQMRLAAPALTDTILAIDYIRIPTAMVADNDITDIPDTYEELVSKGGLARLMEINEDYGEAATERNNLDPLLTAFISNEGRGGLTVGPTVMRTNRGRIGRGVYNADRDF